MDVWVTAIVNEFFRKEFVKQKAEWSMIEKKSFAMVKNKIFGGKGRDTRSIGFSVILIYIR